ncbi:MAG TPA: GSCFA domain-containing protein [Flavisolibacter sp.]|nr:GSCFA domain-containing protein [Flavisolibacter sp.]
MKFRYEFDIKKLPNPINHRHKLFLIGSCFTENIGEKLKNYRFRILENPHGILFNPISVAQTIDDCIRNREYTEDDLFYLNEGWHSWNHHSRFSGITSSEALEKINTSINDAHIFLKQADYVLVTLGSSWVYHLNDKALKASAGQIAANNHKAPADWFNRKLLDLDVLQATIRNMLQRLKDFNPELKIIFTISPVRHLREGVVENNRSKALLIYAVHQFIDQSEDLYYFPAYELVLDDLRDYRFFAEDLVHPNYFATQYVWKRFIEACTNDDTKKLMEEIRSINLAYAHKPFNPSSEQHKKFLRNFYDKTKRLLDVHPYLNFDKELEHFTT